MDSLYIDRIKIVVASKDEPFYSSLRDVYSNSRIRAVLSRVVNDRGFCEALNYEEMYEMWAPAEDHIRRYMPDVATERFLKAVVFDVWRLCPRHTSYIDMLTHLLYIFLDVYVKDDTITDNTQKDLVRYTLRQFAKWVYSAEPAQKYQTSLFLKDIVRAPSYKLCSFLPQSMIRYFVAYRLDKISAFSTWQLGRMWSTLPCEYGDWAIKFFLRFARMNLKQKHVQTYADNDGLLVDLDKIVPKRRRKQAQDDIENRMELIQCILDMIRIERITVQSLYVITFYGNQDRRRRKRKWQGKDDCVYVPVTNVFERIERRLRQTNTHDVLDMLHDPTQKHMLRFFQHFFVGSLMLDIDTVHGIKLSPIKNNYE